MRSVWPFLVTGMVTGAMYGLIASGLVLTYQTSGIFNFAHGSLAMMSGYCYFVLVDRAHLPTGAAALLTIFVFAPVLALVLERLIFRRLVGAPMMHKIIATVGLFVMLAGVVVATFGSQGKRVPGVFPSNTYSLGSGLNLGADQIGIMVVALVTGVALFSFLRFTPIGTAILAVVDRRDVAALSGIDVNRVSQLTWVLATMMAGVAGILLAPLLILDSLFFSLIVIQALSGAMFGFMSSVPLALVGGLAVGVGEALAAKYAPSTGTWVGIRSSFSFLMLFAVLVYYAIRGSNRTSDAGAEKSLVARAGGRSAGALRSVGDRTQRLVGAQSMGWKVAALVVAAAIPWVVTPSWRFILLVTLPTVLVFLSLTVLTGYAGQISLCQAAFTGVGAVFAARFVSDTGLSFWMAVPLAGLVAIPFGMAVGLPALRLSGLHLALLTLGFGLLIDSMVLNNLSITGGGAGLELARPELFGLDLTSDRTFFYVLLVIVVVLAVLVENLRSRPTGRLLRAIQDSDSGVRAVGINPVVHKLSAFALSAFLAGMAGALLASVRGHISALDFGMYQSLLYLTAAAVAGVRSTYGAMIAAVIYTAGPKFISDLPLPDSMKSSFPLWLGLAAVFGLMRYREGLVGALTDAKSALLRGIETSTPARRSPIVAEAVAHSRSRRRTTVPASAPVRRSRLAHAARRSHLP